MNTPKAKHRENPFLNFTESRWYWPAMAALAALGLGLMVWILTMPK